MKSRGDYSLKKLKSDSIHSIESEIDTSEMRLWNFVTDGLQQRPTCSSATDKWPLELCENTEMHRKEGRVKLMRNTTIYNAKCSRNKKKQSENTLKLILTQITIVCIKFNTF